MKPIKPLFYSAMLSLISFTSFGQRIEFHNGTGLSYSLFSGETTSFSGVGAITYHPRVAYEIQEKNMSVSLGAPLSFGFFYSGSFTDEITAYTLEIPITVDLNIGYASLKRTSSDLGGFIGLGYGYYDAAESIISRFYFDTSSSGGLSSLYFHCGFRFEAGDLICMSISAYTYQDFNQLSVYGVRILYEITDFK